MRSVKLSILGCALALGVIVFAMNVWADQWNKKTIVTIKENLQIPGAVLTPGTYVFKLVDSQSNRHIVRVMNEDESKVIATILAIPNYRLQPTGDTEFGFWEMPKGAPPAVRAWFYPGDNFGQEFAYPKVEATQIASVTTVKEEVPVVTEEQRTVIAETPPPPPPVEQPAPAPEPAPQVAQAPEPAPAPPAAEPEPAPAAEPAALPRTASNELLLVLAGAAALGLGVILHAFRQGLA
jgi:outer membrane biosynthesis protein TonB